MYKYLGGGAWTQAEISLAPFSPSLPLLPSSSFPLPPPAAEEDDYGGGHHHSTQQSHHNQGGGDSDEDEPRPIYRPSADRLKMNLSNSPSLSLSLSSPSRFCFHSPSPPLSPPLSLSKHFFGQLHCS